jgi:hypothetical protein
LQRPSRTEAVIYKADLEYVRQLLASTEALCKDVAAAMDEARSLHAQARALPGQLHAYQQRPHYLPRALSPAAPWVHCRGRGSPR